MENGRFLVNDVWYQGSLILFPRQVFLWEIDHPDQIRPHSFDIVNFIKPKPCILYFIFAIFFILYFYYIFRILYSWNWKRKKIFA
jgi:hypothetical protein